MKEGSSGGVVNQRENAAKWYKKFHVSDYAVLLHLPFSTVVLDFAVIGGMMAPYVHVERLVPALIGVFLAHQGSHYLDEVKGRHWNTSIPNKVLFSLSILFLVTAAAIGIYLASTVSMMIAVFILPMVFFPITYSLELWNERFHESIWFGVSCALVCLGSFFLQTLTISIFSVLMSIAVGIQGTYIIILYEATKNSTTKDLAWNVLKGIVLLWNFIALSFVIAKFVGL